MDTIFVNKLPDHLFSEPFVIGREKDVVDADSQPRASLCNAFMLAEKGSDFARIWLSLMSEAYDGTWSNHSTILPYKLSREHPDWVHIEPAKTFYKHMWTKEGIQTLFRAVDPDIDGVVSFHLGNQVVGGIHMAKGFFKFPRWFDY